jgi:hypothetical protein
MGRTSNLTGKSVNTVLRVLNQAGGTYKAAARLNVAPNTLYAYLKKNRIVRKQRVIWEVESLLEVQS